MSFKIRLAEAKDMPDVLSLIQELALYEKAPQEVTVTVEELVRDGFGPRPLFEVLLGELNGELVGIAFYFISYSTWKGPCLYLEDLVVTESHRGKGYGKELFVAVAKKAKEMKARRMSWQVLDWNQPAIDFYQHMGASLDPEWLNGRYTYEQIQEKF